MVPVLAVLLAACTGDGELVDSTSTTQAVATSTTLIPTAEEILADGEITDEERELARRAVFECLRDAGADTTFELFDVDPVVQRDYPEAYQDCHLPYPGISRRNEFPGDRFKLSLLGVVECVEDRTGKDYGPKTVDSIGRLTAAARETIFQAISQDELIYDECYELVHGWDTRIWIRNADGVVVPVDEDNTVWPSLVEYRFDDGDPKRISLKLDACGYNYDAWLIEETDTEVRVQGITIDDGPGEPCWLRHPIRLKHPLGDRVIIDETTGEAVPAQTA